MICVIISFNVTDMIGINWVSSVTIIELLSCRGWLCIKLFRYSWSGYFVPANSDIILLLYRGTYVLFQRWNSHFGTTQCVLIREVKRIVSSIQICSPLREVPGYEDNSPMGTYSLIQLLQGYLHTYICTFLPFKLSVYFLNYWIWIGGNHYLNGIVLHTIYYPAVPNTQDWEYSI